MDEALIGTLKYGLLAYLVWAIYRFGVQRGREIETTAQALLQRAERETDPAKRKALKLEWSRLVAGGGIQRAFEKALMGDPNVAAWNAGADARAHGEPLGANPHTNWLWGPGRHWRRGWRWIDGNPEWIDTQKRRGEPPRSVFRRPES